MKAKKKAKVIESLTQKSKLKRKIRQHLKEVGFIKMPDGTLGLPSTDKSTIRNLHAPQREEIVSNNQRFVEAHFKKLSNYFASGTDIVPNRITPVLQRIDSDTWESRLFRMASLTWSVPVSPGFGRRLRYLVWDQSNGKLIGLIAIGDPVFNLSVRDQYIGWSVEDRTKRLVNILDAYVLGAIPPYNTLLGGKLVASLLRTEELYKDFRSQYGKTTGIISGEVKGARLLAITTTSSMGRSSVYNRVKLDGRQYLESIGFTKGWGHFHIPEDIFIEMREYLRTINHDYADLHRFGEGPNWRLRTAKAALSALGFRGDLLKHGIGREVFLCQLAENSIKILATGKGRPDISTLLNVLEVSELAKRRWIVPRSESMQNYKVWQNSDVKNLILQGSGLCIEASQVNSHAV